MTLLIYGFCEKRPYEKNHYLLGEINCDPIMFEGAAY